MQMTILVLVVLAVVGLAPMAWAEDVPLIPREILFGNPEKSSAQISPDGTQLAYLAPASGVMNVFYRTLDKEDDVQVTSDKKRGVRMFFWAFDGRSIIYLQDKEGDENWHLYQTDLETKMTRDLTPFDGIQARVTAYDPAFPDTMLVSLNVRDRRFHDVYRLNLKNGALDLEVTNTDGAIGFVADNALTVRAAQYMTPDGGTEIRYRKDGKGAFESLLKWGPDESFGGVAGFDKTNRKLWITTSVDANAARFVEMDLETKKTTVIAEDPTYDIGGIMAHPVARKIEAVRFIRERAEWKIIDSAIEADFAEIRKIRDGDFSVVSRDLADKKWVVVFVEDDGPVFYYLYEREAKKSTLLFTNQPKLEKYKLAEMKPISYKARDGLDIHGYLVLPLGKEPKNLPLVLDVHGGPWGRDTWGYDPQAQWLANRGYAVLKINFRGSTGYGKAFVNAGDREWAGKMHDDLLDAKAWAIKQGIADPKKVAIMGGSYGGYAVLVGLAFTPGEFVCGVDIVGPSSLVTLIKSIPPYWTSMKASFDKRIGKLEIEEEFLKSRSPLYRADKIVDPLLIGQGANDPRVKLAESDQIVAAIRKNGKTVEYLVFPDEGHGFARPENRLKFYAAAEAFLARYLGGRVEPPSPAEDWETLKK